MEAWANIVIGFTINFTANLIFLPMFGFTTLTAAKAFGIGLVFTAISLIRSYVLRRCFNNIKAEWNRSKSHREEVKRMAGKSVGGTGN